MTQDIHIVEGKSSELASQSNDAEKHSTAFDSEPESNSGEGLVEVLESSVQHAKLIWRHFSPLQNSS
jgi:hypothetical protein